MVNGQSTKLILSLVLLFVMPQLAAHKYFVGLTEMNLNPRTHHIELIHQFTAHDIETAIALSHNIKFDVGHSEYEQKIAQYFAKNFKIQFKNQKIALSWIGLELVGDQLIVYQEAEGLTGFNQVTISNTLLVNYFNNQINTLNYDDGKHAGSLTFTQQKQSAEIKN